MTQLILITPKRKIYQLRTRAEHVHCIEIGGIHRIAIGEERNDPVLELELATRQLMWKDKEGMLVVVGDLREDLNEPTIIRLKDWGEFEH